MELDEGLKVGSGIWAIVESCEYVEEEEPESDIFTPLMLETKTLSEDGDVVDRKFYVVDVESFVRPIVVIPDIGAVPKCQYLMMAPRSQWAEDFVEWIKVPYGVDEEEMMAAEEPDEEDEEVEEVDEVEEDEESDG